MHPIAFRRLVGILPGAKKKTSSHAGNMRGRVG